MTSLYVRRARTGLTFAAVAALVFMTAVGIGVIHSPVAADRTHVPTIEGPTPSVTVTVTANGKPLIMSGD